VAAFIWGIGIRRLIDAIRRESGARRQLPGRAGRPQLVVSAEEQVLAGLEHGRLGRPWPGCRRNCAAPWRRPYWTA
jgi:RNA polymerase sigma-70 factor (ECF subfamily)